MIWGYGDSLSGYPDTVASLNCQKTLTYFIFICIDRIIAQLFPDTYREFFKEAVLRADHLNEIRLRAEKPVIVVLNGTEYSLPPASK